MKHSVKLLFVAIFCFVGIQSFAQTFGVKGGLTLSNMVEEDDEFTYDDDYETRTGFHIGATVDYPINDYLTLESGLMFTTRGFKASGEEDGATMDIKFNTFYLDIPIMAKTAYEVSDGIMAYGAVGPYIGIGISGKYEMEASFLGEDISEDKDIEWGSDKEKDNLKRLDLGLTFGAGVEYQSFLLGVSYDYGFANLAPDTDDGHFAKNRGIKISVGYRFNK